MNNTNNFKKNKGLNLPLIKLLLKNQNEFEKKFENDLFGGTVLLGERTLSDKDIIQLKVHRLEIENNITFLVGLLSDTNGEEIFTHFNNALKDYLNYKSNKNNY